MKTIKNITIVGIGGVGGYFGGLISSGIRNNSMESYHITFVARGPHFEKIRESGLLLKTTNRIFQCHPDYITDNISDVPVSDFILLCVKSYDLEETVLELIPRSHNQTIWMPLLNGVDIVERMGKLISSGIILPSCVYVSAYIELPGTVTQDGPTGTIVSGSSSKGQQTEGNWLKFFFKESGIEFRWMSNPFPAIWSKYIFVASFALVTAYAGSTFLEVTQSEILKELIKAVIKEISSLAEASGCPVAPNFFAMAIEKARNLEGNSKPSFLRDLEKGNRNEGDIFGITILKLGEKYGIQTPIAEKLLHSIYKKYNIKSIPYATV